MLISTAGRMRALSSGLAGLSLLLLACGVGRLPATAIPAGRPASFVVQTRPLPLPAEVTQEPVLSLASAPTNTPEPNAVATPVPVTVNTPEPLQPTATIPEPTEIVSQPQPATVTAPTPRTVAAVTPDPPLQGGDWDFEQEFIPWGNPYGEPCPGSRVAAGWTVFAEEGQYGSSCFNENLYSPNVFSGLKSQEITFDFIDANSGVLRQVGVKAGRRYTIEAYARSVPSLSPVEMYLGVDLTGGTTWNSETVTWYPWKNGTEGDWGQTEETITASGETITIFIRGRHPLAEQGGKTVIDNVRLIDLGL